MKSPQTKLLAVAAVVVLATVVAVVIPWWIHARAVAMENACIHNLECIEGAELQWALQTMQDSNATPTWGDLAASLDGGPPFCEVGPRGNQWGFRMPKYPPNATYTIGRVADSPKCSYSGHTFALHGLMIHVGDESIDNESGEVFEIYDVPKGPHREPGVKLRLLGSIVGATVEVLDETGHWIKTETGEDGTAYLDTFSKKPVAIVVSKDGFLTSSNSIQDSYRYDYNTLLIQKPK